MISLEGSIFLDTEAWRIPFSIPIYAVSVSISLGIRLLSHFFQPFPFSIALLVWMRLSSQRLRDYEKKDCKTTILPTRLCSVNRQLSRGKTIIWMLETGMMDWEIEHLCAITVDNASSNDVAIDHVRRTIKIKSLQFWEVSLYI